jgi:predicted FMN-binding regulatory protein PaiB
MRHNALHASEDPEVVRRLIRERPWGTLVSHHDGQLAASHQDTTPETVDNVIAALRASGPYHHPALAVDMERER